MYLAHYVTFSRIVLIPLFPLIYLQYQRFHIPSLYVPYILLFIMGICQVTDLIDGFVARKRNEVSDFGKVIDPMADSIMNLSIYLTFTAGWVQIPILLVFVFFYREFFISTLRTICALKGMALGARKSGKIKTFLNAVVEFFIVILMIPYTMGFISLDTLQNISVCAVSIAAIYTVLTMVDYIYANRTYLKKALLG
ncbi:MAG TPA: CDP-alcohol phosphatidyltransferase family protein [Chlamydiales bacterium]|nr:CDP-alcohol phosphatidyltransferase family protein [Chlamydiales bacterium]